MKQGNRRTGGRVLVDALRIHGVDTVFCVPGESYLAALDALYDARDVIAAITCRHEGGAANMAEAFGKLTGRPGVVMVTRGPGACHAAAGLHTAAQDSTPMVMFIGQVERGHCDREAFQEIEYRRFLAPLCKWVVQIDDPARIPELVSQAFHRACSGRPGPVAVALPEDVLAEETAAADTGRYVAAMPGVAGDAIPALRELLAGARRPLVIAGGGAWSARASDVRDDPHAPGTGVPRPRDRHRSDQPGLRGLGGELRGLRREGGAHPRVPRRVRGRAPRRAVWLSSSCGSTRS